MLGRNPKGIRIDVDAAGAIYPITIDPIVQSAYLKARTPSSGGEFGTSVAIAGDIIAIGVPREPSDAVRINGDDASTGAQFSGGVVVFTRTYGVWRHEAFLKASNTETWEDFGKAVALSPGEVLVGAPAEDSLTGAQDNNDAPFARAAYIFALDSDGNVGSEFCSAHPNSAGCAAELSARGRAPAQANDLTLRFRELSPSSFGIFLTSQEANLLVMTGDARYWQYWYRDVAPSGMPTSNFSNAVRVDFQ